MKEKHVEQKLTQAIRKRGGLCPKWVSPGWDGAPDRIILMPEGRIAFAELKAPGKKPRPLQLAQHAKLRKLGFKVYIIDNTAQIGGILDEIQSS